MKTEDNLKVTTDIFRFLCLISNSELKHFYCTKICDILIISFPIHFIKTISLGSRYCG